MNLQIGLDGGPEKVRGQIQRQARSQQLSLSLGAELLYMRTGQWNRLSTGFLSFHFLF
jgi:hypothetical protein